MLKVLYLPLGEQQGMYDAWHNVGVDLHIFNFYGMWLETQSREKIRATFLSKVKEFQPQLIHMQLQFTDLIDAATLKTAKEICPGVIITNWSGDIRKDAMFNFVTLTHVVDYLLLSNTGQLDVYRRAGCQNVRYWQIGYDPKEHFPMWKKDFLYDACFVGNNYGSTFPDGELRASVVNNLKGTLGNRFGGFGAGYPYSTQIPYNQTNEVYNNSICPVSISNFNNVSHYFSDRLLYCVASGRPTISWYFPGIESYFVIGSEILVAKSLHEVLDAINYCKANPEAANKIGMNGYLRVLKEHTYTSRVIELLTMINLIHLV